MGIDREGLEGRRFDSTTSAVLTNLVLPPGARVRLDILDYSPALGRALALRELWRFSLRSGEIEVDEIPYPANAIPEVRLERVLFDSTLPARVTTPDELVVAFESPSSSLLELLELAVRLPPEDRRECLLGLAPVVETMALGDPERLGERVPVLRWIARISEPEADADA